MMTRQSFVLCAVFGLLMNVGYLGDAYNVDESRNPQGFCDNVQDIWTVSERGGWCLKKGRGSIAPGRPMARHHQVADSGIADTIYEIVGSNNSLIDLGAGIGQYQIYFMTQEKHFKRYLAYDGAQNVESFTFGAVRYIDLSRPINFFTNEISDWVMSLEVAEHIPKEYSDVFINNLHLVNKKGIILSWGVPGQKGHSHVNLRPNSEIIEKITKLGYVYDENFSNMGRQRAKYVWFHNTFMVFRRINNNVN